jgi:hypothetical protein
MPDLSKTWYPPHPFIRTTPSARPQNVTPSLHDYPRLLGVLAQKIPRHPDPSKQQQQQLHMSINTLNLHTLLTITMTSNNNDDPYQVFINMTKHSYAYYKNGSGDAASLIFLKNAIVCAANLCRQALSELPNPPLLYQLITNFSRRNRTSLAPIPWVRFGVRPSMN